MKTELNPSLLETRPGREANDILRTCVHCGFCNAVCPTYGVLGDERDGPRGRIYLIKGLLEGNTSPRAAREHLDRCLTCLACETACPSGVRYHHLLEIGRDVTEKKARRGAFDALLRLGLRRVFTNGALFGFFLGLGRFFRPVLPARLKGQLPPRRPVPERPAPRHERRMLALEGCVQPKLMPWTNAIAARLLDGLGVSLTTAPDAGCCGALSQHLGAEDEARRFMKRNIDAWTAELDRGAEGLVMTASGCGAVVREYDHYFSEDPEYRARAKRISEATRDLSEIVAELDLSRLRPVSEFASDPRVVVQTPCSLQHAQGVKGAMEKILGAAGFTILPETEPGLCCGSAGAYSFTEPGLSESVKERKLASLNSAQAAVVASANIGCILHLEPGSSAPVRHWSELVEVGGKDERDAGGAGDEAEA